MFNVFIFIINDGYAVRSHSTTPPLSRAGGAAAVWPVQRGCPRYAIHRIHHTTIHHHRHAHGCIADRTRLRRVLEAAQARARGKGTHPSVQLNSDIAHVMADQPRITHDHHHAPPS